MIYARLAETVRNGTGLDEESSPFAYAVKMHVTLVPAARVWNGAELQGRELRWDATLPIEEQRANVARELCRWLLRVRNDAETEAALRTLYAFMFPACALPASFSLPPSQRLRLLPPWSGPKRVVASPAARTDRRLELVARPR